MALSANRDLGFFIGPTKDVFSARTTLVTARYYPVAAAVRIFRGALVSLSATGHAQPLVAGGAFVGIAAAESNNIGGAAAARNVQVNTIGDYVYDLTGAVVASFGRPVFASDDNTLTFTAVGNSYVGSVAGVPTAGQIILRTEPLARKIKSVVHQIEDVAAGVDIASRGIHVFESEGWIVSAYVVNQATAASGIDDANTCLVGVSIDSQSVASKLFDTANPFPSPNDAISMGAIGVVPANGARVISGEVLSALVTSGAAANPGPFLVVVHYV